MDWPRTWLGNALSVVTCWYIKKAASSVLAADIPSVKLKLNGDPLTKYTEACIIRKDK